MELALPLDLVWVVFKKPVGNKGLSLYVKSVPRKIVLERVLARRAACRLVPGQFNDEKYNGGII
jgi:hypothetical protein